MKENDYVMVINPQCRLYRRRCVIKDRIMGSGESLNFNIYSEGLEEYETVVEQDIIPSKY